MKKFDLSYIKKLVIKMYDETDKIRKVIMLKMIMEELNKIK
jgi:hypothetical protein